MCGAAPQHRLSNAVTAWAKSAQARNQRCGWQVLNGANGPRVPLIPDRLYPFPTLPCRLCLPVSSILAYASEIPPDRRPGHPGTAVFVEPCGGGDLDRDPACGAISLLALLLFVEGTAWGSGAGVLYVMESPQVAWYVQAIFVSMLLADAGLLRAGVYRHIADAAGRTAEHPRRTDDDRRPDGGSPELFFLARPDRFVGAIVPAWYATWDADLPPITVDIFNLVGLVGIVSLAASLSSWARSPRDSTARRQARRFHAIAFGVHDVGNVHSAGSARPSAGAAAEAGT